MREIWAKIFHKYYPSLSKACMESEYAPNLSQTTGDRSECRWECVFRRNRVYRLCLCVHVRIGMELGERLSNFKELTHVLLWRLHIQNLQGKPADRLETRGRVNAPIWSLKAESWRRHSFCLKGLQLLLVWLSTDWIRPTHIMKGICFIPSLLL